MNNKQKNSDKMVSSSAPWVRAMGLFGHIVTELVVWIGAGLWAGRYLAPHLGWGPISYLPPVALTASIAFYRLYQLGEKESARQRQADKADP